MIVFWFFFSLPSDIGAGCRVGTCLTGPLGTPVFLGCRGCGLSGGGAGVALASHEGEHTGMMETEKEKRKAKELLVLVGKENKVVMNM